MGIRYDVGPRFADDLALLSTSRRNVQQKTNELEVHAKRTGLHINTAKTKVMKIKTDDNQPIVIGVCRNC